MEHLEYLSGVIAFVTSFIGLAPQVFKVLKTKSAADLSVVMLWNYLICSVAWIIYGGLTASIFVLSSNVVGLITTIILILQKRYYDRIF